MTMVIENTGRQPASMVNLTTTNATTIVSASAAGLDTVEAIRYAPDGSVTLSIWATDGSTDWKILNNETVSAADTISDLHIQLGAGMSIKAQAGTANKVTVMAIVARSTQNR
jgi:hypothetical protein